MKKNIILFAMASLLPLGNICAQKTRTATLLITASTKYQHIDGFGGTGMNGQWGDVYTRAKAEMLWGQG